MTPEQKTVLSRGLLGLILILFLMPFMTLYRGESKILSWRGIQMVSGATISTTVPISGHTMEGRIKPQPLVAAAFLAAILGLSMTFAQGKVRKHGTAAGAGGVALFLLLLDGTVREEALQQFNGLLQVSMEMPFWFAAIGATVVVTTVFYPDKELVKTASRSDGE